MKKHLNIVRYFNFLYDKPYLLLKIIKNYFRMLLLRQKVLRIADIALTFNCNARCSHCCSSTLANQTKQELTIEEVKDCIKQSLRLGAIIFNFLGGEPLLSKHIYEAIEFVHSNNAIAGISTNGLLLTEKVVQRLKKSGLDVAQVSLESANDAELDRIRGVTGCYNRIVEGIHLLQTAGIKVTIGTILTPQNIANGDIWKIVQLARKLRVILTINAAAKVGSWSNQENISLSSKNLQILNKLMRFSYVRWAGSTSYLGEYCPCGTEKIFITAYGDVIPCGVIHISYGNIREEPLEKICRRMYNTSLFRRKQQACPAALDRALIETYLEPLKIKDKLPISISEAVEMQKLQKSGRDKG